MIRVSGNDIKPGMVLAADVYDKQNRLILPKGTVLDERNLRGLLIWGIQTVMIEDGHAPATPVVTEPKGPDTDQEALAAIDRMFRLNTSDGGYPLMQKLRKLSADRYVQLQSRPAKKRATGGTGIPETVAYHAFTDSELANLTADALILRVRTIASLPQIYSQLIDDINRPSSSAGDIAEVISSDTGLTARLLRIVNSAFFGFPGRIETISRAITVIGTTQLCELALATSVIELFNQIPASVVSQASFWEHSVACGVIARGLGLLRREANVERLFIGGLLHDVGRAVLLVYFPDIAQRAIATASDACETVYQNEFRLTGFTHADVGEALLASWSLPRIHCEVVGFHHRPSGASQFPTETAIVHVADIIAHAMMFGSSGDGLVPPLQPEAWDKMGISPSELPDLLTDATQQITDMVDILSGE
jgi:HD-like signal output (HDOD) protein